MARRIPLMEGWEYEETSTPNSAHTTLAGFRPDHPAGLPLVTSTGVTLDHARADLVDKAHAFDGGR